MFVHNTIPVFSGYFAGLRSNFDPLLMRAKFSRLSALDQYVCWFEVTAIILVTTGVVDRVERVLGEVRMDM